MSQSSLRDIRLRDILRNTLPSLSSLSSDETDETAETSTFRALYFLTADEGRELIKIFPKAAAGSFPRSYEEAVRPSYSTTEFYAANEESYSHGGRNCGRKFKMGEPIYRCYDCGFDNTCVLCVHCFNKDDHKGHQVTATICGEVNEGICDCGDPEAWVTDIHCKSSSDDSATSQQSFSTLNTALSESLLTIYSEIFKFIISVFSHQNQSIPSVQEALKSMLRGNQKEELLATLQADINISNSRYDTSGRDAEEFNLIFWNDEYHNFQEAQAAIKSASRCDNRKAIELSRVIDREGRAVLSKGIIKDLLPGFESSITTDFTASIMSTSELKSQNYVKILLKWLSHSINFTPTAFQTIARRALCAALCSPLTLPENETPYWNSKRKRFEKASGLLHGCKLPKKEIQDMYGMSSNEESSVLQYLLFFDIRYWKRLRKEIHELLISSLVADLEYKFISCKHIVNIYDLLLQNLYYYDREPHLNMMSEISTQYFTCPLNSTEIVSTSLINVIIPMQEVLQDMMVTVDGKQVFQFPTKTQDKSNRRRKTVRRITYDLALFFQKSNNLDKLYSDAEFSAFFKLVQQLDNCWEIQRKTGDHIEIENYSFSQYFDAVLYMGEVIVAATNPEKTSVDVAKLKSTIFGLIPYIQTRHQKTKKVNGFEIVDFVVSKEKSGFLHPSSILLSKLLGLLSRSLPDLKSALEDANYLNISDISLRTMVLQAQIESQFWIRNGNSALSQALTYKTVPVAREHLYKEDLHICQLALLAIDKKRVFLNILDRFELLNWFMNGISLDKTVYEEKVITMIEKLVSFLYLLLTERETLAHGLTATEKKKEKLRTRLIYNLFVDSLSYTEIEDLVDENDFSDPCFEEVLREVTIFTPPKGLNDDGRYSLKPEFYKIIDPLRLEAQTRDFQDSYDILAKALVRDGQSSDDVVIEPKFNNFDTNYDLGSFTRTLDFAKFISKLLSYAVEHNSEPFVPFVLHLLHAAIIDNEQINGNSSVIEAYTHVPICENLFSIYNNSDFSKSIKTKADFILEKLVVKDREMILESLASCFGADSVNKYKESKKSNGVDFDETEAEKKRRLAKERQKKIMAKMQKKQKAFIEKNDSSPIDRIRVSEETKVEDDTRYCVLCQNAESIHAMVCAPMSFNSSSVFRSIPLQSELYVKRAFLDWSEDSIENSLGAEGLVFPSETMQQDEKKSNFHANKVASSCNHHIHFRCLTDYMDDNNYRTPSFPCPLCKTTHDTYVPTTLKKYDLTPAMLNNFGLHNNEDDIDEDNITFGDVVFKAIAKPPYIGGIQDLDGAIDMNFKQDYGDDQKFYNRVKELGSVFAYSISQAEISTRVNGTDSYTNFLSQIPEQTYRALKSLLQYYLVIGSERDPPKKKFRNDLRVKLRTGDFIDAFIFHLFSGTEGFTQFSCEMIKFFTSRYVNGILVGISRYPHFYREFNDKPVFSNEFLTIFRNSINLTHNSIKNDIKDKFNKIDKFASDVAHMVQSIIFPDLRNLAILYKVLIPDFDLKFDEGEVTVVGVAEMLQSLGFDSYEQILRSEFNNRLFSLFSLSAKEQFEIALPYPGVIKLIDLPNELNYFTTRSGEEEGDLERFPTDVTVPNGSHRIDFAICLTCGHKVFASMHSHRVYSHLAKVKCSSRGGGALLFPNSDLLQLICLKGSQSFSQVINAPYMTSHGQSGERAVRNGLIATLNYERFKHLNNLWLTGGIYPYLTRNCTPVRIQAEGVEGGIEARLWRQFLAGNTEDIDAIARVGQLGNNVDPAVVMNLVEERMNGLFGISSDQDYSSESGDEDDDEVGLYGPGNGDDVFGDEDDDEDDDEVGLYGSDDGDNDFGGGLEFSESDEDDDEDLDGGSVFFIDGPTPREWW